jgi:hypothetical protein
VFLLVLRLLAVYFGTAAVSLWLAHRFVSAMKPRVAIFLALIPFLVAGRALVTAGVFAPLDIAYQAEPLASLRSEKGVGPTLTPMIGDVVYQEIPWRKAVREAVKNGRVPLWNRFILAGEPLLAVQQPAVIHPATWIGFLLPLAQAWTFEMALGLFLASLCAYLFFRELALSEVPACLGAAAWALSDYLRFCAGYPMTPAAAPFPLLLLGLRRLARRSDRGAVALTAVALFLITVAGHSETLLHCVAAGGVYFLFELSAVESGRRARAILLSIAAGIIALGLCAVVLVPLAEALPHTWEFRFRSDWFAHAKKSLPLPESLRQLPQFFAPYILGVSGRGDSLPGGGASIIYTGSLVLALAAGGLLTRYRERWAFLTLSLLGVAVWARLPLVTDAVSSLPFFNIALNERLAFVAAFGVASLAALGTQKIRDGGTTRFLVFSTAILAVLVTALFVQYRAALLGLQMPRTYLQSQFLMQLVPLLLAIAVCAAAAPGRSRPVCVGLLALVLLQRSAETASLYPTMPNRAFYPPVPLLQHIPRGGGPFRVAAVGFTFIPNISAMYELEDVRGYEAMTFRPLVDTFPLWCERQLVWFNRIDDPTRPFLSFLNVRYILAGPRFAAPSGWNVVASDRSGQVLENPRVLPRAFIPGWLLYERDAGRQLQVMRSIGDFQTYGVVEAAEPSQGGEAWRRNGAARVESLGYGPDRLRLEIVAQEPAVVATSVTAWPGWRLTVDGKTSPFLGYNRAFLAFRVTPGRHSVELGYRPRSVVVGSVISAATLCLGVLLFRAGARARQP